MSTLYTVADSGRARLLAEALKLFAAKGYVATSVADIQRVSAWPRGRARCTSTLVSKRELLEAAVTHRIDNIVAACEQYGAG